MLTLFFYLVVSFVFWDITWLMDIPDYSPLVRLGIVVGVFFSAALDLMIIGNTDRR